MLARVRVNLVRLPDTEKISSGERSCQTIPHRFKETVQGFKGGRHLWPSPAILVNYLTSPQQTPAHSESDATTRLLVPEAELKPRPSGSCGVYLFDR